MWWLYTFFQPVLLVTSDLIGSLLPATARRCELADGDDGAYDDGLWSLWVLSERTCPSDGLVTERYSDGTKCSTWFSYNGWAAANSLEALVECL